MISAERERRAGAQSKGSLRLAAAGTALETLAAHFTQHASVTRRGCMVCIDAGFAWATLWVEGDTLRMTLEAIDNVALDQARLSLSEHLEALTGAASLSLRWSGVQAEINPPAFYRRMRVLALRDITPRMRRITLHGVDLQRFSAGGLHVRLLFPATREQSLPIPRQGADGKVHWPPDLIPPVSRVYTLRHVNAAAGTVEIDMLLHPEASGPGAQWAMGAVPGDEVGMIGPRGAALPPAAHYLLMGDETALPAMARHLETLPGEARVTVLAAVFDAREEQPLPSPARLSLRWLHRGEPGLAATLAAEPALLRRGACLVWAGCERKETAAIRILLREAQHPSAMSRIAAYWQREDAGT